MYAPSRLAITTAGRNRSPQSGESEEAFDGEKDLFVCAVPRCHPVLTSFRSHRKVVPEDGNGFKNSPSDGNEG